MSIYFNCGASGPNGRFRTKKALRDQLAADAAEVYFDGTAPPFQTAEGYRANELPEGLRFQVTGPDPYTSRRWYATVVRQSDGSVKIS
jgi:hypothetical protein